MSGLGDVFARCRRQRRAAFIPYLTGGDPDSRTSEALLGAVVAGGADIVELGVPFRDAVAGVAIHQRAARRALAAGASLSAVLRLVARYRERLATPMVLVTCYNPVHARGAARFAEQAASSGVDGVLCLDAPPEEGGRELGPALSEQGIDLVYALAPATPRRRVKAIAAASRGFIRWMAPGGASDRGQEPSRRPFETARRVGRRLELPLAISAGITTVEQVAAAAAAADGVVVGSALARVVEEHVGAADLAERLERRLRELRRGIGA